MLRSVNKQLDDMQGQLLLKNRDRHLVCGVGVKHLCNLVPGALVNQLQIHPIALDIAATHCPIPW
ncbi:MAG: hypothetical protein ABL974_20225 [Prosthecobacter sp.]